MGLKPADTVDISDKFEVDMLIGSDLCWSLVTGRVIKGKNEPTAIHTKVGWVLSGPIDHNEVMVNYTLKSTYGLKIDTCSLEASLNDPLKRFW